MDWQGFSRIILADHQHEPQTLARLEFAVAQAKEALQILSGHGHQFHLEEGPGEKLPEWPKKLYHVDSSPNGVLVYTEEEAVDLGPGWFDSFSKAQFWDGVETQFQGRGGVAKSARLPVPLLQINNDNDPEADATRLAFIAAFRALNRWERPHALEEPKTTQSNGGGSQQSEVRPRDRDSPEGGEGLRGRGQEPRQIQASTEQEKFQRQVDNFGQQGMTAHMQPRNSSVPLEAEPEAVTLRDISDEAAEKVAAQ